MPMEENKSSIFNLLKTLILKVKSAVKINPQTVDNLQVGQTIRIKSINENNEVEWETADFSTSFVDTTLSQQGMAADAKITGDELAKRPVQQDGYLNLGQDSNIVTKSISLYGSDGNKAVVLEAQQSQSDSINGYIPPALIIKGGNTDTAVRIASVANGVGDHDAVNMGQLKNNYYTKTEIDQLFFNSYDEIDLLIGE